jgi:hypothetical protein
MQLDRLDHLVLTVADYSGPRNLHTRLARVR